MAVKSYFKRGPILAIEQGPTALYAKLTVGSTGAVSATAGYGLAETTPIVRNGAGNYTISLDRSYKKLLKCVHTMVLASPQDLALTVTSDDISTGSITVEFSIGGTATDPSSGAIVLFEIVVADTSLTGGV
jgi:hypothetical protein